MKTVFIVLGIVLGAWLVGSICHRISRKGKVISVNARCVGCKRCLRKCRKHVLEAQEDAHGCRMVVRHPAKCTACGDCIRACKLHALELVNKKKYAAAA